MTTLRRELRETLQLCLDRQLPFVSSDIYEGGSRKPFVINRQLRYFVDIGILERHQLIGSGMPFQYRIVDRERAKALAAEQPRPRYERAPQPQRFAPGISFIFHMGAR